MNALPPPAVITQQTQYGRWTELRETVAKATQVINEVFKDLACQFRRLLNAVVAQFPSVPVAVSTGPQVLAQSRLVPPIRGDPYNEPGLESPPVPGTGKGMGTACGESAGNRFPVATSYQKRDLDVNTPHQVRTRGRP